MDNDRVYFGQRLFRPSQKCSCEAVQVLRENFNKRNNKWKEQNKKKKQLKKRGGGRV